MTDVRRLLTALALCLVAGCTDSGTPTAAPTPTAGSPSAAASASSAERIKAPAAGKLSTTDEFGLVTAVTTVGGRTELDVDRVDMLGGAEAQSAAAASSDEVSNDYYVVNDSPLVRHYIVATDVVIWGDITFGHVGEPTQVTLDEWRRVLGTPRGRSTMFHFQLRDGVVVGIEEQYVP